MTGPESEHRLLAAERSEAHQSRGPADDKPYESRSGEVAYAPVLGDEPYLASDAELAAMPAWARDRMLLQRERSKARWSALDAQYARSYAALRRLTRQVNRQMALRTVDQDGATRHLAVCACGWHSLRTNDPEVARREYDAHACTIEGDEALDRAQRKVDTPDIEKRPLSEMTCQPSINDAWSGVVDAAIATMTKHTDDTEERMALLELT